MSYAVLFPGQGSQAVGMGADVRAARPEFLGKAAGDVLGWDLGALIEHGPETDLTRTEHAQPAIYAVSYALWDEFRAVVSKPPTAAAGHSLGEYTALAAAEVYDFPTGLRLVAERGRAMAAAAAEADSGMAALLGADAGVAETICADRRSTGGALFVANINAPGQIVVAGGAEDIAWLTENARDLGVRRAIPLKVAGAFHSPFMAPAASALAHALASVSMGEPTFDVYANASARPADDVAASLREQLTATVRFQESLEAMRRRGIDTFVHIGPGDVTAGLAKRTVDGATVHVASTLADARAVAEAVSVE